MARPGKRPAKQSTLRIIGGQWRGRKLVFTPTEGLRPTTDRVRETVFNWLAPRVQGAHCLDLFAGSGALGLEALSRGATECDFVDTSPQALRQILHHLETLQATSRGHCHGAPAQVFLASEHPAYDIVFIDPPFGKDLVDPAIAMLNARGLVAIGGVIYIETSVRDAEPAAPAGWHLHREKVAGDVAFRLYVNGGDPAGDTARELGS
jgi:16S rRNA (guanine966-N2)-methyltransferase